MREFQQEKGRTTKPQVWKISRIGSAVKTIWGQLDGTMQETTQEFKPVNAGKSNAKDSPVVAQEWMDRQILLRTRKGYREVDPRTGDYLSGKVTKVGDETIVHGDAIDFDKGLPNNLRFYKPKNTMNAYMEKLVEAGKAWFTQKRNGNMFVVVIDPVGESVMYSSTLSPTPKGENLPWAYRFGHLDRELKTLKVPSSTILLCELIADLGVDDLDYVGTILRAKSDLAIKTQRETGKPICLCIWDVAYWAGEQWLGHKTYRERREALEALDFNKAPHITAPEILVSSTAKEALELCKKNGWEGWVVIDPDSTYGDRGIAFHGKADRPKECCKLKPKWEADFILRWDPDNGIGTWGKGKKSHGVGAFFAYLLNDEGDEVFVSKVGGGLTDDDVKKYAEPGICFVAQVEFASVTKDGSLQFPEFVRPRPDKTINECTFDQLPKAAEEEG